MFLQFLCICDKKQDSVCSTRQYQIFKKKNTITPSLARWSTRFPAPLNDVTVRSYHPRPPSESVCRAPWRCCPAWRTQWCPRTRWSARWPGWSAWCPTGSSCSQTCCSWRTSSWSRIRCRQSWSFAPERLPRPDGGRGRVTNNNESNSLYSTAAIGARTLRLTTCNAWKIVHIYGMSFEPSAMKYRSDRRVNDRKIE